MKSGPNEPFEEISDPNSSGLDDLNSNNGK
jgi:hypothetical protein